jgi:hypothetical protein
VPSFVARSRETGDGLPRVAHNLRGAISGKDLPSIGIERQVVSRVLGPNIDHRSIARSWIWLAESNLHWLRVIPDITEQKESQVGDILRHQNHQA